MKRASAMMLVLVAATICSSARPATADSVSPEREARRHFEEGESAYKAGHYAQALEKYQAGYAAKPLPGFLVNIAQCQRRLGDLKAARATYGKFLLVAPDSRLAPEVQELIRRLDTVIADLDAGKAEPEPEAASDGDVDAAELAPPPGLPAAPAQAPAAVIATSSSEEAAPSPRHTHTRWWLWGGIAAAAIAGGVVAGLALSSPENTTIRAGSLGTLSR